MADVASPSTPTDMISLEDRCLLLSGVPAFALLPTTVIQALAGALTEERYAPGSAIVTEGEAGDRVYLLTTGQAEVTSATPTGPTVLGVLRAGELFGEVALLHPDGRRTATVTAVTDVHVFSLSAAIFHAALAGSPDARAAFAQVANSLLIVSFLKQASPFAPLKVETARRLATRLESVHVAAGEDIMRQGESGDRCYLLRTGQAEILLTTEGGTTRRLGKVAVGGLVGEAALLTDSPRNATVRAIQPCELLALRRADLREIVESERDVALPMLDLVQVRDRPMRVTGVQGIQRTLADGTIITTLKDPARGAYYRLSPEGYFIWQQLDGEHTLRDIALDYLTAFRAFAPQAIASTIAGLAAAGFVTTRRVSTRMPHPAVHHMRWERMLAGARRLLEWEISLPSPDRLLGSLYTGGVRWLYTLPAQIILALVFLSGLGVFVTHLRQAQQASVGGGWVLLFLLMTYGLTVLLHELGHALTVKAFGCEVPRAGVGWYWFGPIAYIDTSDMWLADRWPRLAVTLGGLYASGLVASAAALGAVLAGPPLVAAVLWQLSFFGYVITLTNLNPLMELDGYFLLMDWLDRPNLRRTCLAWLGRDLPHALRQPQDLAAHQVEVLYGLGAVLYIVFSSYLMLGVYRPIIQAWLHAVLPQAAASAFAWLLTAALVSLALLTLAGDLRGVRRAMP